MAMQPRPLNQNAGFSLIELLVVLAILAALSIAFVSSIGSKSPRAVKTALLELKSSFQEARQAAISGGRSINLVLTNTGEQPRIQAFFTQPDGTIITDPGDALYIPPVVDRTFEKSWRRYANFTTDSTPVPTEDEPMAALPALVNYGFTGWGTPVEIPADSKFGISSTGQPEALTGGGTVRSAMTNGTWVGIVGKQDNEKGQPYGGVFVTSRGLITAFYKPDAELGTQEFKWQRFE